MKEIKSYFVIRKSELENKFPYVSDLSSNDVAKAFVPSILQAKHFTTSEVIRFFDFNEKADYTIERVVITKQAVKEINIDVIFENEDK